LAAINATMMQYFHWTYPSNGSLWGEVTRNARSLADTGFTALWLPPAYKARDGAEDVGYGTYDLFDFGEFNQKGSVRTKYGTRAEFEACVQGAHQAGLQIYLDTVMNHKGGADGTETVIGTPVSNDNRNIEIGPPRDIDAWTLFNFPGRGTQYSSFQWHWYHFDAVDYDQRTGDRSIFRLRDKHFETPVDPERGNFDFLLFADIDMSRDDARNELKTWGRWVVSTFGIDGFRLDAVKHIWFPFFIEWLDDVRGDATGRSLFAVGEYFTGNVATLRWFIEQTQRRLSLFDFPLRFNLRDASRAGSGFDMRNIFAGTLVEQDPDLAVTFLDNHDTYQENRRDDAVQEWFRPIAYALILLREGGYPCVFYPDYFGFSAPSGLRALLDRLVAARRDAAYGPQTDYFDDAHVIGWTRAGDADHPRAMAVILSNGSAGSKRMTVGRPNRAFADITGNIAGTITTGADGAAAFRCNGGSVSVWVEQ
jgi:alpha-amylase